MKQLLTLSMGLLLAIFTFAQAPQEISYQAVIRDGTGDPITNSPIDLRFSIHENSAGGPIIYQEEHTTMTNDYGLLVLTLGSGTPSLGTMSGIDWESATHFLEVEQDTGSGYVSMGASQMMSVPYALYAEEAKSLSNNTIDGDGTSSSPLEIAQQGAINGDVLMWDGATWIPSDDYDPCRPLDDAYDCGVAGGGRIIEADAGALQLDVGNNDGMKINMTTGSGNTALSIDAQSSTKGIYVNSPGNNYALHINKGGDAAGIKLVDIESSSGPGVDIEQHGAGSAATFAKYNTGNSVNVYNYEGGNGITVYNDDTGDGIEITKPLGSIGDGIEINHNGTGEGIQVFQNSTGAGISIQQSTNGLAAEFVQTTPVASSAVDISGNNTSASLNVAQYHTGKTLSVIQFNVGNNMPSLISENKGNGPAGEFIQSKATAGSPALKASTSAMGAIAVFDQMNAANGTPAIMVNNFGTGVVLKLDQMNPANPNPVIHATNTGNGVSGRFQCIKPTNAEPALDVLHTGVGHGAYIASTNPSNPEFALNVLSSNAGGGLHIEGTHPATETLALFELAPTSGVVDRVAHFSQTDPGAATVDEVVLISTNNTLELTPALIVSTPTVETFAAEFNGKVEITGALTADGEAMLNDGLIVTGNLSATGVTELATTTADDLAVFGMSELNGDVQANGNLNCDGTISAATLTAPVKMFTIDHPLDPENKTLHHACIESNEIMNLYSGNVVLDENGNAVVELPAWFEALNTDARYQLTCVGGFANVYVKEKLSGNRFIIGGGYQGLEVSWQLTAVRHDKFAMEHPLQVEREKESKR